MVTSTIAFRAETTVEHALQLHPHARWVFAAYHLSGCTNCSSRGDETLAEVALGYQLSLDRLLGDLNSLLEGPLSPMKTGIPHRAPPLTPSPPPRGSADSE